MLDELLKPSAKPKAEKKESLNWCNRENSEFYDDIGVEGIIKLSYKAGLFTGCDVKKTMPFWKNNHSILDFGSGFGRVIKALIENGFEGNITSVERNHQLFEYISNQFKNTSNVTFFNQDAFSYIQDNIHKKFDSIFMLWSGLGEYNPDEQSLIIKRISEILEKNGHLIIDTMAMGIKPIGMENFAKNSFSFSSKNNHFIRVYEPSYDEVNKYAKNAKLKILELISYLTDTNRPRCLYILKKLINI